MYTFRKHKNIKHLYFSNINGLCVTKLIINKFIFKLTHTIAVLVNGIFCGLLLLTYKKLCYVHSWICIRSSEVKHVNSEFSSSQLSIDHDKDSFNKFFKLSCTKFNFCSSLWSLRVKHKQMILHVRVIHIRKY